MQVFGSFYEMQTSANIVFIYYKITLIFQTLEKEFFQMISFGAFVIFQYKYGEWINNSLTAQQIYSKCVGYFLILAKQIIFCKMASTSDIVFTSLLYVTYLSQ